MKGMIKTFANISIIAGSVLVIAPVLILIIFIISSSNKVEAFDPEKETQIITAPIFSDSTLTDNRKKTFKDPFSQTLTQERLIKPLQFEVPQSEVGDIGTNIRIPSLRVNTTVYESWFGERALERGVWRDPNHGTPDNNAEPIVIAAHRWGQNGLSWDYRKQHLFADFDQLKVGDVVIITWNGREYKYKINFVEVNTTVTRVEDLILYTCVDYTAQDRIIVYAELSV